MLLNIDHLQIQNLNRKKNNKRHSKYHTPRKINMEPENTPLEKESIIFQTIIFRFDLLIFRGVTHIFVFFRYLLLCFIEILASWENFQWGLNLADLVKFSKSGRCKSTFWVRRWAKFGNRNAVTALFMSISLFWLMYNLWQFVTTRTCRTARNKATKSGAAKC